MGNQPQLYQLRSEQSNLYAIAPGAARMADAFSQPGLCISLLLQLAYQTETKSAKREGYLPILMFSVGLLIGKPSFSERGDACGLNLPFWGTSSTGPNTNHSTAEHRRPHSKQDERSSPILLWSMRLS